MCITTCLIMIICVLMVWVTLCRTGPPPPELNPTIILPKGYRNDIEGQLIKGAGMTPLTTPAARANAQLREHTPVHREGKSQRVGDY